MRSKFVGRQVMMRTLFSQSCKSRTTYQALEIGDAGNLIVTQLKSRQILIASQMIQIRALELIIGEFDLYLEKRKAGKVIRKVNFSEVVSGGLGGRKNLRG